MWMYTQKPPNMQRPRNMQESGIQKAVPCSRVESCLAEFSPQESRNVSSLHRGNRGTYAESQVEKVLSRELRFPLGLVPPTSIGHIRGRASGFPLRSRICHARNTLRRPRG